MIHEHDPLPHQRGSVVSSVLRRSVLGALSEFSLGIWYFTITLSSLFVLVWAAAHHSSLM